jgi:hypothetical protein
MGEGKSVVADSVYEFTSISGQNFLTEDPQWRICPECGRSLVLDWKPTPPSSTETVSDEGAS